MIKLRVSIKREYNQRNIQIGTLGAQVDNVEKEIEKINYEIAQIKNSPAFKTVKGTEMKKPRTYQNLKKHLMLLRIKTEYARTSSKQMSKYFPSLPSTN